MSETRPLRDQIADVLRTQIVTGAMAPGDRLREEHIAEEQRVSRVPVREALQRLEREGYVVLAPRRGARVALPSPERVMHVMEVRRALEVFAARRAADNRGGEVADDLRAVLDAGLRAVAAHDLSDVPGLIDRFHDLVAVASGNSELVQQLDALRSRVRWLFAVDVAHRSEKSWSDHEIILTAILAGDADRAAELMDVHVARDEDLYRGIAGADHG